MSMTITGEQRDVLYEQVLIRLTGISDVYIAVEEGDFDAAQGLSGEFADYLLLLHEGLGWGDHHEGPVQLTASPDVVRRVLGRLMCRVDAQDPQEAELAELRAEVEGRQERNRMTRETCEQLLAEL
jgi:hypothetical protein